MLGFVDEERELEFDEVERRMRSSCGIWGGLEAERSEMGEMEVRDE